MNVGDGMLVCQPRNRDLLLMEWNFGGLRHRSILSILATCWATSSHREVDEEVQAGRVRRH